MRSRVAHSTIIYTLDHSKCVCGNWAHIVMGTPSIIIAVQKNSLQLSHRVLVMMIFLSGAIEFCLNVLVTSFFCDGDVVDICSNWGIYNFVSDIIINTAHVVAVSFGQVVDISLDLWRVWHNYFGSIAPGMDWIWGEITEIDKFGFSWVDTITLIEIFCFHKGITVNFPILMPLKRDPVSSDIFQWYCIEISVQLVRVLFLPLRYGHCGVQSNTRYDGLDVDSKHDHHQLAHDDVIKWKHFLRYWPFVRGIHRSPVNSRTKASDAELWCFLWSAPE